MYIPQGLSLCLFKDKTKAINIATNAAYQAEQGSFDSGQYTIEGSRPANILYLHASFHLISSSGYSWLIEDSMKKTAYFVRLINSLDCFSLVNSSPDLNIINYQYIPLALQGKAEPYTLDEIEIISNAVDCIQKIQFGAGKTFVSKTTLYLDKDPEVKHKVFRVVLSNPLTNFESLKVVLEDQINIAKMYVESDGGESEQKEIPIYLDSSSTEVSSWNIPLGKPVDNTFSYILNDALMLCPIGTPGELHIGGSGLARGYLNRVGLTAEKFIDNPFHDESNPNSSERLYKTGDLVRWLPDGNLEYLGRIDHQVKIRGFRIELGEIEYQLLNHDEVNDAVVVALSNVNGDKRIVAYVTHDEADKLLFSGEQGQTRRHEFIESLRQQLTRELLDYMVPSAFVVLESLPLTPNGKVDRKALPAPELSLQQKAYVAPTTETEKLLCELWQDLLAVERVGVTDNFFEVGGHSLLVAKLVIEINRLFSISIELKQLFNFQKLNELAAFIDDSKMLQSLTSGELSINSLSEAETEKYLMMLQE